MSVRQADDSADTGSASDADKSRAEAGGREKAPRTIVLVSCVNSKRSELSPARELCTSSLFQKASAYAERAGDAWYILSAKYGLVAPDREIAPYDQTLNHMPAAERRAWAKRVAPDLAQVLRRGDRVVILAGVRYREYLLEPIRATGCTVEIPMKGLGLGEQLCWLTDHLAALPTLSRDRDHSKAMPADTACHCERSEAIPSGALPAAPTSDARLRDVQRLYRLLDRLETRVGGRRRFAECKGRMGWPERGVYLIFEPGEERTTSGGGLRLVRVGTHAVYEGSQSTLWARLRKHRGTVGGAHPGGGNHRTSVFRRLAGAALINRYKDRWPACVTERWGVGQNAPRSVREREYPVERAVSEYIGQMWVLWLEVDDEPGPASLRSYIERNAIALLSNMSRGQHAIDPPSDGWLGHWAAREGVRGSGLWNVDYTADAYEPGFLDVVERQLG